MLRNPFEIVKWFEEEIAHYTGAPYAVATNSCTNAIFLACKHLNVRGQSVTISKRTYLSVPQSIMQAGGTKDWIASKTNIQLFRINRDGSASLKKYKLDLRSDMSQKKNPPLRNGDIVKVNPSSFAKLSSGLGEVTKPMSNLVTAFTLFKLVDD